MAAPAAAAPVQQRGRQQLGGWQEPHGAGGARQPPPPAGRQQLSEAVHSGGSCCLRLRGWALARCGSIIAVAVLLALEGGVLLWALRFPEPVCVDLPPVDCFPDWRSYFVVAVVLGAWAGWASGRRPTSQ